MTISEAPRIDSLLVADWAEAINGKLYVMGGAFDTVWAQQFPYVVRFAFAAVLKVPWNDTNRRLPIRATVQTTDGEELDWRLEGELEAGRPPGERGADAQIVIAAPVGFQVDEHLNFVLSLRFADDERSISLKIQQPPFTSVAPPAAPPG